MNKVILQNGDEYDEPEKEETTVSTIRPLNGYFLVEDVKDDTIFQVTPDQFSPSPMVVIAKSLEWQEGEVIRQPNKNISVGDTVLTSRVYVYRVKDKQLIFAKESDIVAVL